MRIALTMEYSQAPKNQLVEKELIDVAQKYGHQVINYGQFSADDQRLTYNEIALMNALILNGGAADFVVTGCGTGMGAMIASNAFIGVTCGFAQDPSDAFLFSQINNGNAISLPYAKGFGWGAEVNLRYMFERLFEHEPGRGYPPEAAASEQYNAQKLIGLKSITHRDMPSVLSQIDDELAEHVLRRPSFRSLFNQYCQDDQIKDAVTRLTERLIRE